MDEIERKARVAAALQAGLVTEAVAAVQEALTKVYGPGANTNRLAREGRFQAEFSWSELIPKFDLVGAGCFSVVLDGPLVPAGYVFKLSLLACDQGPAYWRYCMDNPDQEYVPEVSAMGYDSAKGWRWCLMEKCEHTCVAAEEYTDMRSSAVAEWAGAFARVDLHSDNYMRTVRDGRLVITDPVSVTPTGEKAMGWSS